MLALRAAVLTRSLGLNLVFFFHVLPLLAFCAERFSAAVALKLSILLAFRLVLLHIVHLIPFPN
jgi:hypothetical protein